MHHSGLVRRGVIAVRPVRVVVAMPGEVREWRQLSRSQEHAQHERRSGRPQLAEERPA
jgi:hypothetical protein